MTQYTFKPKAFAEAAALLTDYYGIELVPSICQKDDTIVLESSKSYREYLTRIRPSSMLSFFFPHI